MTSDILDRRVIIDGLDVCYREAGDSKKPTIVFLHGWAASRRMLIGSKPEKIICELSHRFHVIAPELPGFMTSDPPTSAWGFTQYAHFLKQLLEHCKVNLPIMLGHSYGGGVAAVYAQKYPVKTLFLANAVIAEPKETYYRKKWLRKGRLFGHVCISNLPSFIKKIAIMIYLGVPYKHIRDVQKYIIMESVSANTRFNVNFETLSCPVFLLWGEDDRYGRTGIKTAKNILGNNVMLYTFKGGHRALYIHTKKFVDRVCLQSLHNYRQNIFNQ